MNIQIKKADLISELTEEGGVFNTDCGEAFITTDNPGELDSWAKFCIYCGKALAVRMWEDPENQDISKEDRKAKALGLSDEDIATLSQ